MKLCEAATIVVESQDRQRNSYPKVKDVTWHIFRHTYISRLVMAGVDLRTVQELAGHKDIKMTVCYAHLAPAHKLAAVDRLAEYRQEQEKAKSQKRADSARAAA